MSKTPTGPTEPHQLEGETLKGATYVLIAYVWWGLMVIYFKLLVHLNPIEVVAHRIVWTLVITAGILTLSGTWGRLLRSLRTRQTVFLLMGSATVICCNWLGFIWSVETNRVSQASLGYYINPLVSVLLGFLFLHERLRPMQRIALIIATIGVIYQTVTLGVFPWISLFLAFSFGLYGLFRKLAHVDPVGGLVFETAFLLPFALGAMLYIENFRGGLAFFHGTAGTIALLPFAGVVTATPLILFSAAARRLPLATIGFLQYINPTVQLLLAVLVYGEAFSTNKAISFVVIWSALALYTFDMVRSRTREK